MTDYLFLIRHQGDPMAALSPAELQRHLDDWAAWMGGLAAAGRLRGGQPLGEEAACVRTDLVTDGPYAEAKDVVGGYVIVGCASVAEAKATAMSCPGVAVGSLVEVRAIAPVPR